MGIIMSTPIYDSLTSVTAQLNGDRSKVLGSTYSHYRRLSQSEIDGAYASGFGIARKIIERPANDAFSKWREWHADIDQIGKIEAVEKKLKLKDIYKRSYRFARKDGEAYIFFDDGRDASKPITEKNAGPIRKVVMLKKSEVAKGDIADDVLSDHYGMPKYYELTGTTTMLRVDPSRMIMLTGDEAANSNGWIVEYDSVIARCFDAIRALELVNFNVADMTTEAKLDIIKIKGMSDMAATPEGEANLIKRGALLSSLKSIRSTVLLDGSTEEWDQKTISFATLPEIMEKMQIAVCGAVDVPFPHSLLFGESSGGLGSSGNLELSSYYDGIQGIQSNVGTATHLLDMCVIKTALGSIPPEIHYNWKPLWQESTETRTQNGERIAKIFGEIVAKGILSPDIVAEPLVNALTEAGVAPGLEAAFASYVSPDLPDDDLSGMIEPTEKADND